MQFNRRNFDVFGDVKLFPITNKTGSLVENVSGYESYKSAKNWDYADLNAELNVDEWTTIFETIDTVPFFVFIQGYNSSWIQVNIGKNESEGTKLYTRIIKDDVIIFDVEAEQNSSVDSGFKCGVYLGTNSKISSIYYCRKNFKIQLKRNADFIDSVNTLFKTSTYIFMQISD